MATKENSLKNFIEILPSLMLTLNNISIVAIAGDEKTFKMEHVRYFLDKECTSDHNYILVDEWLSNFPFEKVIMKKGMTDKDVLKKFGFANA